MLEHGGHEIELQTLYTSVKNAFREAGLPTPDLDARLLVTETLGVSTAQLIANPRRKIAPDLARELHEKAKARLAGQSIGRILGRRAFWSLDLRVSPHTLEPRPETETVVELALAALTEIAPPVLVADLGVGTGAILLSILSERLDARGVGVDVSELALRQAARNAERHNLADRTLFVQSDFGAALAPVFDLVVSNPPYIATADIEQLDATVRDYDPRLALDGGIDGLDCYRTVFRQAGSMLRKNGRLIVEIDPRAHDIVVDEAARHGLIHLASADDLSGRPRAVSLGAPRS
ncbi:peptide chain release factor N(5)-glutamine methyltransferase [Acuticoccus sp. MNP-M23]|uniref:peptide chain release factor N(5)-glutamine methyltransferase n=1 Tax=Acuticoccus sp. MNP-M23 TaxID=3072793 RepID=UPI002815C007|nr:peptide chain release factor N(5)-glutamine methyltransferase [Acuticoccus sp. MNP-M23]WMS41542.1 peptide chain release factor N(5)-glutamine methyltransferase [Acuticoccus sp. MNP-M23]